MSLISNFIEEKELLHAVDDCCFYVFTNVKGSVTVAYEQLDFLSGEPVESGLPEVYLSESASGRLYELFGIEKTQYCQLIKYIVSILLVALYFI